MRPKNKYIGDGEKFYLFCAKSNFKKEELADKLGVSNGTFYNLYKKSTFTDEEKNRISTAFNVDVEEIFGEKSNIDSSDSDSSVNKIREDKLFNTIQKGIIAVPIKAQANYSRYFNNTVFKDQLERIYIPNSPYDGEDFRYFQLEGDSMEYVDELGRVSGIADGSWIIAEKVPPEDWKENLRLYYVYVVVTDSRITIKRVLQDNKDELVLHADNELYGQERVKFTDIKEMWIFKRKLDWNAPPPRKIEIKI